MKVSKIEKKSESSYWDKSRLDLLAWLERNAPSLGELYKGAVILLFGNYIPGKIRFISHAVREIRNRLPDHISGPKAAGNLNYKGRMDVIVNEWKKLGLPLDGSFPITQAGGKEPQLNKQKINAPKKLLNLWSGLIHDHEKTRAKPIDAAIRLFQGCSPHANKFRDSLRPIALHWLETTEWFMQKAHDNGRVDNETDEKELRKQFELFESLLRGLIGRFFETTDELNEILEEANS